MIHTFIKKIQLNFCEQNRSLFAKSFGKWRGVVMVIICSGFLGYSNFTSSQIIENQNEESVLQEALVASRVIDLPVKNPPNFALDEVKEVTGAVLNAVVAVIEKDGRNELWLFDLERETSEDITSGIVVAGDFPIGFKDGWIFWLSEGKEDVFAFHPQNKILLQKPVPYFESERGERARISFSEIAWDVLVDADNFYFFNDKNGEVFSDGNSEILELFRKRFELDMFLTKEELGSLSFSIEEYE